MSSASTSAAVEVPAAAAVAGPVGAPLGTPRPRRHVLVVSVVRNRRKGVVDDVRYILETGSQVTLLGMRASDWPELEGQVTFREIESAELRHPLMRVEQGLVVRLPNLLVRLLLGAFRRAGRVPGVAAPSRVATAGTRRVHDRYTRLSGAFHKRIFLKGYHAVRPWVLWRTTRSLLLPDVDLDAVDLVLLADAQAVSIGWHLAKARPELPVTFSLDRSALPPVLS